MSSQRHAVSWIQNVLEINSFSIEKIHIDENDLDMITNILFMTKMIYFLKKNNLIEQYIPIVFILSL